MRHGDPPSRAPIIIQISETYDRVLGVWCLSRLFVGRWSASGANISHLSDLHLKVNDRVIERKHFLYFTAVSENHWQCSKIEQLQGIVVSKQNIWGHALIQNVLVTVVNSVQDT